MSSVEALELRRQIRSLSLETDLIRGAFEASLDAAEAGLERTLCIRMLLVP